MNLTRKDFKFHGVSKKENDRLADKAYQQYVGDIHGQGGQFVMSIDRKRPVFDKGSSVWHESTTAVEEYIELLETRLIELDKENEDLKGQVKAIEHNRELTIKWARGEVEN